MDDMFLLAHTYSENSSLDVPFEVSSVVQGY